MWKLLKQSGIFEKWICTIYCEGQKKWLGNEHHWKFSVNIIISIVTLAVNELAWLFILSPKRRSFSELHEVTIQKTALFQQQEQLCRDTVIFRVIFLQLFLTNNFLN
jgi:hypothetical protein